MDTTSLAWKILELLAPVLTTLLIAAIGAAFRWLSAHTQSEYLHATLMRLNDATSAAVKDVQQRLVEKYKAAAPDGKLSAEAAGQLKTEALALVKTQLGQDGLRTLAGVLGLQGPAIDALLGSRVEAAVHDLRELQAANRPFAAVPLKE